MAHKTIDRDILNAQLNDYIDTHDEPMIQEFCLLYGYGRQTMYDIAEDNEQIAYTMKRLMLKQEIYLVKQAEAGKINPAFAIFRLKQRGFDYKDKQEIEHTDKRIQIDLAPELKKLSE
jgi:hypothetical protein